MKEATKVYFVERIWRGHTITYCKLLTKAFLNEGLAVCLICPQPEEVVLWCEQQGIDHEKLSFYKVSKYEGALHNIGFDTSHGMEYMCPIYEVISADLLRHPSEGCFLYINLADFIFDSPWTVRRISKWLTIPWGGMYLQPLERSLRLWKSRKYRLIKMLWPWLAGRKVDFMTTVDELCLPALEQMTKVPVIHFPEVTDETPPDPGNCLAREIAEFAQGRKVVGFLGYVASWKGAFHFLRMARRFVDRKEEVCFVMCGSLAGSIAEQAVLRSEAEALGGKSGNLFLKWGHVNEGADYNSAMFQCSVYWCLYDGNIYKSNNMTKAAMMNIPVIGNTIGYIADAIREYRVGLIAPSDNEEKMEEVLLKAVREGVPEGRYKDFFNFNSQASLAQVVRRIKSLDFS